MSVFSDALKKSRVQETLYLSTDADSSTDTKTDRNGLFFLGGGSYFLFVVDVGVHKISRNDTYFFLFFLFWVSKISFLAITRGASATRNGVQEDIDFSPRVVNVGF